MKATGIVRRIDELGRVVIPKEIRRTLSIHENDPLEIFTGNDGEIVFKKYYPLRELSNYSERYAGVLCGTGGYPVIVCDRDKIISVAGAPKKELMERRVSNDLEDCMVQRKSYVMNRDKKMRPVEGIDYYAVACAPIIAAGDVYGAIMFISDKDISAAAEVEIKLISAAALFLSKLMED